MPGENLDIAAGSHEDDQSHFASNSIGRRFIGVHFVCCDIYTRIYINRDGSAYEGHCPKCAKAVRLRVGADGTNARFFAAG